MTLRLVNWPVNWPGLIDFSSPFLKPTRDKLNELDPQPGEKKLPKSRERRAVPDIKKKEKNNKKKVDDLEKIFTGLSIEPAIESRHAMKIKSRHGKHSFLSSLSADVADENRHPDALPFVKSFRKLRDDLTARLFEMFNVKVFNNQLARDFSLTWNKRLTRTAGKCRHVTKRTYGAVKFESNIKLSVKVVDSPCRLRDTLIHEMCHAATWMIDNCRGGHGPVWRKWADEACRVFPELPAITRCHNYEITYKFYYNCRVCSYSLGRHSKSVDTDTHTCPRCRGRLQLSKDRTISKENCEPAPLKTPRAPNAFAMFVQEHYAKTKASTPDLQHAAIMKVLSLKFAETKKASDSR
nr:EOG090X0464 [Leptodora kindtii]